MNIEKQQKYMRPIKGADLAEIYSRIEDRSGQLNITVLHDCEIEPSGQIPGISEKAEAAGDILIDDCDYCARVAKKSDSESPRIEGKCLYGGYMRCQWGHFLLNTTARLWPLFTTHSDIDKILFFTDTPGRTLQRLARGTKAHFPVRLPQPYTHGQKAQTETFQISA